MSNVSIEDIVKTLGPQFPETSITVSEQLDGFQQVLAKLTLAKPSHNSSCYLKCFVSNASWWTGNAQPIFEREVSAIRILNSSGLSAPNVLASGETGGVNWLLLDAIDGKDFRDDPLNVDPEKLGAYVARMHAIDVCESSANDLSTCDTQFMETRVREMASRSGCPSAAVTELTAIAARFGDSSDLVFCHGDLGLGNILVCESGHFTILDFEESVVGYRQYDVGELALGLRQHFGEERCQRFLCAYASASGSHFSANFIDEWEDFSKLRDRIVGIHMNSVEHDAGLPFSTSFVDDDDKARRELEEILIRRGSATR